MKRFCYAGKYLKPFKKKQSIGVVLLKPVLKNIRNIVTNTPVMKSFLAKFQAAFEETSLFFL